MKNIRFIPKYFFLSLALSAMLALLIATLSGMEFWVAFGIAVTALLVNGVVAEIEDRITGGFLNPKSKDK